jgi:GNAT superfamily N-acetyltransferase
MGVADLRRVAQLSEQLGYPVEEANLERRFTRVTSQPGHAVWVAVGPEGNVVGWLHVHAQWLLESEPYAEIGGLVVDSGARRSGAGRALVALALDWARSEGFEKVRVRSNAQRVESHQFYPAVGFTRIKTSHTYEVRLVP